MSSWIYSFLLLVLAGCHSLQLPPGEQQVVIPAFEPKKPIHIALVLGGGGVKGLAHLGAIEELENAGIRPDLIIGCSAGAIAGAVYADQPTLEGTAQTFIPLKRADLFDYSFFRPLFGIVEGNSLQAFMNKTLHAKSFEELKIPLILVATDLITGETVEISSGELPRAVRASCAFPGLFKPVLLYGRYLVDGAVSSPVPVSIAKKYGAEIVIAIDLNEKLSKVSPRHLLGVTKRSLEISYQKFGELSLSQADIIIKMDFDEVGLFSDHLNKRLYEHGRRAARKELPGIILKLSNSSSCTDKREKEG